MSFIPRIKPRDQYLRDFFQQESDDPMADLLNEGDPYDPISPERIVEMREAKSKEEPGFWESFKHYSGLQGAGEVLSKLNLDQLFPSAQKKAVELGQEIGPASDPTGGQTETPYWFGPRPATLKAGMQGFGQGVVENTLPNINLLDFAPAGRAAKYATAFGNIADTEKLVRSAEALKGLGKGLETTERLSGGLQSLGSMSGVAQGAEDIGEGNYAQGVAELAGGIAGTALGARSTLDNWTSPENVETAYNKLEQLFPVEGMTSDILSHGRYQRPGEVEPINPKLIERSQLPFQESNRKFLENESMQDQFDFARRAMDISQRNAEPFVPEVGGELEGITFDPELRGGNLGGDIRLNTELIARNAPDLESYLQEVAKIGTHESVHGIGQRPHGQELIDAAGQRVMRDEIPNEADIELGQTRPAMPENIENFAEELPHSITRPFENPEGYYQKEPSDADFSFRTANEAAQNATRQPVEDLIQGYLKNPNDRATLEHAYLMQRGERPRGSSYRDYTDEAVGLSEVGPVESIEAEGPEQGARVFHGTPYEFDKFSDDAIGSGEGSQAFGRGHYVAEDPQLARHYADNVARNNVTTSNRAAFDVYKSHSSDIDSAISATTQYTNTLKNELRDIYDIHGRGHSDEQTRKLSWEIERQEEILDHLEKNTFSSEANLLSVDIPDEGYIELDKTLGEQSPEIQARLPQYQQALRRDDNLIKAVHNVESALPYIKEQFDRTPGKGNEFLGDKVERLEAAINDYKETGNRESSKEIYNQLVHLRREKFPESAIANNLRLLTIELDKQLEFSNSNLKDNPNLNWFNKSNQIKELSQQGIKGIKFRDRQSRYFATETPSHNYVIFDPEDAKIVNKRKNLTKEELAELEKKYGRENLSKNVQSFFEGQPVEIIRRNKDRILIKLPDGTEQIVHPSKIKLGVEVKETLKGQYEDITAELEALEKELGGEDVTPPKHITEQLSDLEQELTLSPEDVSVVAEDKHIFPEYATPNRVGRPGKQGPPKPPKEMLEDVGEEGEGKKPEDWLKTAAREVPKIERAQSQEIIRDQGFRNQIRLQDQLLKAQELEALKEGKGEEAQKIAMERKILRAQNAEEFSQYKRQQKTQTQSEKEQLKLQEKILKGQTKEDLELRKQKESFVGKGEDQGSPKGIGETLIDIWRVPAALKSSLDIPALSHSLTDTLIHPIKAAKNIKEAGKAALSPEHQERILTEISQRKNFKTYQEAGLQFTKQGYDPNAQTFGSYTAEKIPGVKASERAQNVFLDKRRADLYDTLTKDMGSFDSDPYGHKKVAELVNAATGYGKLKSQTGEKIITGLNQVMWSARLRLSRLNHLKLLGEAFVNPKMPASARKEIFKQASATVGLGIGLLKLAEMAGAEVDLDPRSSKFARAMWKQEDGKVISWNPFAAYTPVVKLASQELTGTKITEKGEFDLTENKPFQSDRISILGDYGYSGLNPSAKAVFDALSSKTEMDVSPLLSEEMTDEHTNFSKALELVTPINVGNQKQLYDELGPVSALFAPLTSVGSNIDVYDPEKFTKQRERAMRERGEEPKKKKKNRTGKVLSSY